MDDPLENRRMSRDGIDEPTTFSPLIGNHLLYIQGFWRIAHLFIVLKLKSILVS